MAVELLSRVFVGLFQAIHTAWTNKDNVLEIRDLDHNMTEFVPSANIGILDGVARYLGVVPTRTFAFVGELPPATWLCIELSRYIPLEYVLILAGIGVCAVTWLGFKATRGAYRVLRSLVCWCLGRTPIPEPVITPEELPALSDAVRALIATVEANNAPLRRSTRRS